jgi:hypothetical protein
VGEWCSRTHGYCQRLGTAAGLGLAIMRGAGRVLRVWRVSTIGGWVSTIGTLSKCWPSRARARAQRMPPGRFASLRAAPARAGGRAGVTTSIVRVRRDVTTPLPYLHARTYVPAASCLVA